MPLGKQREKVVFGLARARRSMHRYSHWRWGVAVAFTLGVAAIPAFDVLRFDLWAGRHQLLGREVGLLEVARAFAFPFLAVNVAIIVVSRWLGRYLCGFVCPYGAIARLAEWLRFHSRSRARRIASLAILLALCGLLSAVTFVFWVDPRVFVDGSTAAVALAALFFTALVTSFTWMVSRLGQRFCRDWCPSGVYFAMLGHDTRNGVEFAHPESCTDCGACEQVCPMDLVPRAMSGGAPREGKGLYPDGASSFALCVRCGDCIAACEATTARNGTPTPLRMGFLSEEARTSSPTTPSSEER
jgi:polyferredoxin